MKQSKKYSYLLSAIVLIMLGSCKKYKEITPISGAAYVRIFNSMTNFSNPSGVDRPVYPYYLDPAKSNFFTVLIDPVSTGSGIPETASIIADNLGYRYVYSLPYPAQPLIGINGDYPGGESVLRAPIINNLDLSNWAQISSGKHRVVILNRVKNTIPFSSYPSSGRDSAFKISLDTTINIEAGKIYTWEILYQKTAPNLFLYTRQERYDTGSFSDTSKMYLSFYNLISNPSLPMAAPVDIYYQYQYFTNCGSPLTLNNPSTHCNLNIVTAEKFLYTVNGRYATSAPFVSIPFYPMDSLVYHEVTTYNLTYRLPLDRPAILLQVYKAGQNAAKGNQPILSLKCQEVYNTLLNNSPQNTGGTGAGGFTFQAGLYNTVTYNNDARPFTLINTIEFLDNGYIYQYSVQHPINLNLFPPQ